MYFDRVAQQFGMTCVLSTERQLVYKNDAVFMAVNFDNGRSFEIGVEIGLEVEPRRAFSLAEIMRLRKLSTEMIDGLMVVDTARLQGALELLARLTLEHASDFLSGNKFSFAQISKLSDLESKIYAHERDLRSARAKAEIAWTQKQYPGVVATLTSIEQYLSPAEIKRLDYARKHS